jgi:hypothetical protein
MRLLKSLTTLRKVSGRLAANSAELYRKAVSQRHPPIGQVSSRTLGGTRLGRGQYVILVGSHRLLPPMRRYFGGRIDSIVTHSQRKSIRSSLAIEGLASTADRRDVWSLELHDPESERVTARGSAARSHQDKGLTRSTQPARHVRWRFDEDDNRAAYMPGGSGQKKKYDT